METLTWKPAKKEFGCTWHYQGIGKDQAGSICIDVFVMPTMAQTRPLAVTMTLRDGRGHATKHQLQAPDEMNTAAMGSDLARALRISGRSDEVATAVAAECLAFISGHADAIHTALRGGG